MKKLFITLFLLSWTVPAMANEYPTEETVRYILGCMQNLGGQNDENLYTCACRYDAIRNQLTFRDYDDGRTFERNKAMAGEKGAFFRDNKRGEGKYENLIEARKVAENSCITVKHVKLVKPTNKE